MFFRASRSSSDNASTVAVAASLITLVILDYRAFPSAESVRRAFRLSTAGSTS